MSCLQNEENIRDSNSVSVGTLKIQNERVDNGIIKGKSEFQFSFVLSIV